MRYLIEIRCVLDAARTRQFEDLGFLLQPDEGHGVTRLLSVADLEQPQLHATLKYIRDVGLELLRLDHLEASPER